jgi:hypothetical protein
MIRGGNISFEQFDGFFEDRRETKKPLRFFRRQLTGSPATRQCALGNADGLGQCLKAYTEFV